MEESHEHIINIINKQSEVSALQFKTVLLEVEAGFTTAARNLGDLKNEIVSIREEMEGFKEAKEIQNHRIDKLEKTFVVRASKFGEQKTKLFFFYVLIAYLGLAELIKYMTLSDILKKYIP